MEELLSSVISSVDDPAGVAAIAILVYGIAFGFKQNPKFNNQALPVLAIVMGAIIGTGLGFFTKAGPIEGLFTGAFSGMIATGGQELYKSIAWLIPVISNRGVTTSSTVAVPPDDTTTTTTIAPSEDEVKQAKPDEGNVK